MYLHTNLNTYRLYLKVFYVRVLDFQYLYYNGLEFGENSK